MTRDSKDSIWEVLKSKKEELDEKFSRLFQYTQEEMKDIFKQRAEDLSTKSEEEKVEGDIHLVCNLGEEYYAFPLIHVVRMVVPEGYVKIPSNQTLILGVLNYQNEILPVVAMKKVLNLDVPDTGMKVVVILGYRDSHLGVEVEGIKEILTIKKTDVGTSSQKHPSLKCILPYEDTVLGLIDVPALFHSILQSSREG